MATTRKIFEGIKIIVGKMTEEELDGYEIETGHDQLYCGMYDPDRMTEQETSKLKELGWFESEDSWSIFT